MLVSESQRLTIAIALSALKFKPPHQSIPTYVLDLQAAFPIRDDGNGDHHPSDEGTGWRERALELEKKVEVLQRKYDENRIELSSLRSMTTRDDTNGVHLDRNDPAMPKKGKKKDKKSHVVDRAGESAAATGHQDIKVVLDELSQSYGTITTATTATIFQAFRSLQLILEQEATGGSAGGAAVAVGSGGQGSKPLPMSLLIRSTHRAIEAVGSLLGYMLPDPSRPKTSASLPSCLRNVAEVAKTMAVLTSYVISTALPVLMKKAARRKRPSENAAVVPGGEAATVLNDILGLWVKIYFIPLVRSFGPASMGWVSGLFSKETGCAGGEDIRPRAFALIQFGIKEIDRALAEELSPVEDAIRHVKERIALEAVRELERIYDEGDGHLDVEKEGDEEEEAIRGLACKDALWYLVNVFHATLGSRGQPGGAPPNGKSRRSSNSSAAVQREMPGSNSDDEGVLLLRDAVLTCLSGLLSRITVARTGRGRATDVGSHGEDKTRRRRLLGDGIAEGMILAAAERYWTVWCVD